MKGARAVDLDESFVEPWGLAGDRRWLLVDRNGRFISQREKPPLARVIVSYESASGSISVSAGGVASTTITPPAPDAPLLKVTVWSSTLLAAAAGPEADAWFSAYLRCPVRLVYLDDPTRRPVNPQYGRDGDVVSFADGYPLLLTSAGSLEALGGWLAEEGHPAVPMNRFRPSVVVAGTPAWAEDGWRRIRIGTAAFRVVKPCGRCVVTTIDQATAERGRQPLELLGRRRRFGQQLVFGQNMIPDAPGFIRVGEPLQVLEGHPPAR